MKTESDIEIRPLFEMEDFTESDPGGSVMDREADLRNKLESR